MRSQNRNTTPAPPPSRPPPPQGGGYSGSVPDLIRSLFPASEEARALCTAHRESRFDPHAYNPSSGASGVFQWIPSTWRIVSAWAGYAGASAFDARANVATAAYVVTTTGKHHLGWSPWSGGCV